MSPTLVPIALDDPNLSFAGAQALVASDGGVSPRRLSARALRRAPDPMLEAVSAMPSGVRLVLRTSATRLRLRVLATGLRLAPASRRPVAFDLRMYGALIARCEAPSGPTVVIDRAAPPPGVSIEPGGPDDLLFDGLPDGEKTLEIWLPQSGRVTLLGLAADAPLQTPAPDPRPVWAHYGSSISHGMEADGPSETWPATAALCAGTALMNLGFAGQCHLDPVVARVIRDLDPDLISLKLGINVLNLDSLRERTFVPAVHGFLDLLREAPRRVPILIVSPILVPAAEDAPGPTLSNGGAIWVVDRPPELRLGALTARRIRALLADIVERRRAEGDLDLHYLDGLSLFGPDDVARLPDGLHPDAAGLKLMGERFAARVFGPGGAFSAAFAQKV